MSDGMSPGVIGGIAAAALTPIILKWAMKSKPMQPKKAAQATGIVAYTKIMYWMMVACLVLFLALAVACLIFGKKEELWVTLMFGGFAIGSALVVFVFSEWLEYDDTLIRRHAPWAKEPVEIRWDEIASAKYSAGMMWTEVKAVGGKKKIHISAYMGGANGLLDKIETKTGRPVENREKISFVPGMR